MADAERYNNIQLVGLGGTGCNVLETFVRSLVAAPAVLKDAKTRIALLAFDVADPDVAALRKAMGELERTMKDFGIPSDKVTLVAETVRFPTVETLYNFVQRWPEFWETGGPEVDVRRSAYRPFIDRTIDIPPLVGGVGRRRALSKAMYGLNYHLLRVVDSKMEIFKQHVLNAETPLVYVIYGMGGGSGSGMALDFARHLRARLGRNVPIYGLGILPCPGDDPAAKGPSAYAALTEHEALVEAGANRRLVSVAGSSFENPFNFFLTVPLGPAFTRSTNLPEAKRHIDEAIVDSLFKTLNFDMADMSTALGTGADAEGRWVNTLTMLQVSLPIVEHVELARLEIERLDHLRKIHTERRELYGTPERREDGAINRLLDLAESDVLQGLRAHLLKPGEAVTEERLKVEVQRRIRDSLSVDKDFMRQLMSQASRIRAIGEDLALPVRALGFDAKEGDLKEHIHRQATEILDLLNELPTGYGQFEERVAPKLEDLEKLSTMSDKMTAQEREIIRDLREATFLVTKFLTLLRRTEEIASLSEMVFKDLTLKERPERFAHLIESARRVKDSEIRVARQLLVSMLSPAEREKNMELLAHEARAMRTVFEKDLAKAKKAHLEAADRRARAEDALRRAEGEQSRFVNLLNPIAKRNAKASVEQATSDHETASEEARRLEAEMRRVEQRFETYSVIETKFSVNSEYRKVVGNLMRTKEKAYAQLNEASKDRGLYHKVKELTEAERLRILQRVLSEDTFRGENIAESIIDRDHLMSFLKTALSSFRNPTFLGLTADYRTENLWFVTLANKRLWTNDLTSEIKTALSGYVTHDVDRAVTVRHVPTNEPYTLRFLLVAAKARPEHLEAFDEMRSLYLRTPEEDRKMSHSLALERGGILDRSGTFVPFASDAEPTVPVDKRVVP